MLSSSMLTLPGRYYQYLLSQILPSQVLCVPNYLFYATGTSYVVAFYD